MYDWKTGERELLAYLNLNGPSHQRRIAESQDIVPATLHLAKNRLLDWGLIRMVGTIKVGRGAPRKVYGLTPAGLLVGMLEGDLWNNVELVLSHWDEIAPVFVKRYVVLWENDFGGLVKEVARSLLIENREDIELIGYSVETVPTFMEGKSSVRVTFEKKLHGGCRIEPWEGVKTLFDWGFYRACHDGLRGARLTRFLELVRDDGGLLKGWSEWYDAMEERFNALKEYSQIVMNRV